MTSNRNEAFLKKAVQGQHVSTPRSNSKSDDFFVQTASTSDSKKVQKKVFNKSKWRLQKYSMKNKLETWKNKRADYIRHEYNKMQNRNKTVNFNVTKVYLEEERRAEQDPEQERCLESEENTEFDGRRKQLKKHKFDIISEKKKTKEQLAVDFLKKKTEKEKAIEIYRKNKIKKYKKLNRKTKKGQPVMKGRMELLLERIQGSTNE